METDLNTTIKEGFQEPRKRFWLRSRKRTKSDAISINSMDISLDSDIGKKRKRRITEVASSIFLSTNKLGNTLHSSFNTQQQSTDLSFVEDETNTDTLWKRQKNNLDAGNITLRSWIADVAKSDIKDCLNNSLTKTEIKRQEAIYELFCGENVLLNDLFILRDSYYKPLLAANILNSDEVLTLFGDLMQLIKIHSDLRDKLIALRDASGYTETVGPTLLNWLPSLKEVYTERCRTQVWARHLIEKKKTTNKRFQLFLKRRLESTHAVDLWTYIDVPRSRIVKYPLLLKEILKHASANHEDRKTLKEAIDLLTELLKNIDIAMGDAECKLGQSKINIKVDYDPTNCIKNAVELITEGQLKDIRGMKFHCFLFNTCFAITRPIRRISKKYNLSFPVISNDQIIVPNDKDQDDLKLKIGDHTLLPEDKHGKRHWIDCFKKLHQSKFTVQETINVNEKENQSNFRLPTPTRSKRKSISSVGEIQFSFSMRKNLLKQKRNSTGYV